MNPELHALYLAFVNAAARVILNNPIKERYQRLGQNDHALVCALLDLHPNEHLRAQMFSKEMPALSVYRLGLTLADLLESEHAPIEVCNQLVDLSSEIQSALDTSDVYAEGPRLRGSIQALFQLHLAPGYVITKI